MSLFTIFQISSQGMTAQRQRLEAASSNLANSNTTRTVEGGAYKRRDVVFETTTALNRDSATSPFGDMFENSRFGDDQSGAVGVNASTLVAKDNQGIRQYQPNHPDADADGYVTMPDVDPLEETVNMMSAARSFEGNATAFNTAKELARATLKLGDA